MVGLCGIVGDQQHDIDSIAHTIEWSSDEETSVYKDESVQVYSAAHTASNAQQPETVPRDNHLLWVWGDIIGFEDSTGYTPRREISTADSRYCAELLESYGLSFVDGLNSEFAGIVLDQDQREATLFTDRLGARPIYFTDEIEGCVVFSTNINTILAYPDFNPSINRDFLSEFMKLERVFGVYTPFDGITQVHPGSKLTCDLEGDVISLEKYWVPKYRPTNKNYDLFAEEFTTSMQKCVSERSDPSTKEGLFISGGSDSRLLLSMLDGDVTGYHLNDSMNIEAETAREVCNTANVDFRFLQRDHDYLTDVLERVSDDQIFSSYFDQAHFNGFEEEIKDEVDAVFSGHTSDTILEGFYMPTLELSVPGLNWTIPLPVVDPVDNIDTYRDYILRSYQYNRGPSTNSQPDYLQYDKEPIEVLDDYMHETTEGISHHGVTYPSLESLAHAGGFYPLTNNKAYFTYYMTNQMLPTHYPYLDNRVIDFSLSLPHRHHSRRSIVNRAITTRNKALAEIPKSGTGLPLTYPRTVYSLAQLWRSFKGKFWQDTTSDSSSWSDNNRTLRETDIAEKHLLNQEISKRSPAMIDWDVVEEMYRDHLNGGHNYFELYALLSLCNSYPAKIGLLTESSNQ